jgi:hypothetical protein
VFRRSLVLFAALAAVLVLAPAVFAARVHVRVEGKTQTIFGSTEPTLNVQATVLDSLESASLAGEFFYHITQFPFGPFVDQIGRYPGDANHAWLFKVNGIQPQLGAGVLTVKDGDTVLWYWAAFSGPPVLTLEVETSIVKGKRCFFTTGRNDAGHASRVRNVVFTLNSRRVSSAAGVVCTNRGRYAVRVSKAGAVRSRTYSGR